METVALISALKNLTSMLSILSFVLSVLVLVDCIFLYKRITAFIKKQDAKRGNINGKQPE